uniref:ACB domain-containing protein n=1 Tax=Caenorhabditis japonica TaxID=281687 RepID=A0A8R1EC08_CAEJA
MSRAGYKGKHGNFEVPIERLEELNALYMQATVGDYDGNTSLKCAQYWKRHSGKTQIESIREYIKLTNMMLTKYGWNPPEGWV